MTSWEEVRKAKAEKRRELVLTGKALSKRLSQTDGSIDAALFDLRDLNFLDLSSSHDLTVLPDELGRLEHLSTLVASGNSISEAPGAALAKLAKLKVLDLSSNKIDTFPEESAHLQSLTTLNLSLNRVLSTMPSLESLTNLSHVDLSGNALQRMDFLCHPSLVHLAEVLLASNQVSEVPANISCLPALKKLDLSKNQLKKVPGELADCLKLKELNLGENPLEDNRFKKMVAQKGTKAVVDYIRQHFPKMSANGEAVASGVGAGAGAVGRKGKGGKKAAKKAAAEKAKEEAREEAGVDIVRDLLEVTHLAKGSPQVVVDDAVKEVRPFLVCFLVRNVDLSSGDVLKRFIQVQTRLHDGVCQKRVAATIATHDLAKIPAGKILYTARPPKELMIAPLGQQKEFDAEKLVNRLRADAEQQRKEKKRSSLSGVHNYLKLLKGDAYACLVDSRGRVVSFPPITNCEGTRISDSTRDLFVEVTSGLKLQAAKDAADTLIQEMLELGLGRPVKKKREDADFYSSSSDDEEEPVATQEGRGKRRCLTVEQLRVEDPQGNLKVAYPARTDLPFAAAAADSGTLELVRA